MDGYTFDATPEEGFEKFKKLAYGFLGVSGVLGFMYTIQKHYQRLNKKKTITDDNKSETMSKNSKTLSEPPKDEFSEDLMEKLVEKIKNNMIHTISLCLANFMTKKPQKAGVVEDTKKDDDQNKEKEKNNDDDIVIEQNEVESGENMIVPVTPKEASTEVTDFLPDFERGLYAYNQIRQGESVMSAYQVLEVLVDSEKKIIQSFNIKISKYQEKLAQYSTTNQ